jgi:glutamate racemase
MMNLNEAFQSIFGTDMNLIEPNDPRAKEIQRELDAEHDRQARSGRQIYWPPGTLAPRKLNQ